MLIGEFHLAGGGDPAIFRSNMQKAVTYFASHGIATIQGGGAILSDLSILYGDQNRIHGADRHYRRQCQVERNNDCV
jgi:hypothetical protein